MHWLVVGRSFDAAARVVGLAVVVRLANFHLLRADRAQLSVDRLSLQLGVVRLNDGRKVARILVLARVTVLSRIALLFATGSSQVGQL